MNKLLYATVAIAVTLTSPVAFAADPFYVGAALGTRGTLNIATPAGSVQNTNHPTPYRVYGGYNVTENFAIEAGYKDFGKYKFALPASVSIDAFYVAGKGSVKVGESWSLFGKIGVSHVNVDENGVPPSDFQKRRAMFALGADYSITSNVALGLEVSNFGKRTSGNGKLALGQLEASVKYSF